MFKGSCLCSKVKYELSSEPKAISNCHCQICRKQHGAAFATYGSVPVSSLKLISGESELISYNSSKGIKRLFCGRCGSNLFWRGSEEFPDWVSVAIATLDTPIEVCKIKEINLKSKACWLSVS